MLINSIEALKNSHTIIDEGGLD